MTTTQGSLQNEAGISPAPGARLITLDSQMAASGYDCDHPWRMALADAIADEVDACTLMTQPTGISPVRAQAYEIENCVGHIAVLVEAIFDKIDEMTSVSPEQIGTVNAINTFANSAMESARAIREANEQILSLTGGVQ